MKKWGRATPLSVSFRFALCYLNHAPFLDDLFFLSSRLVISLFPHLLTTLSAYHPIPHSPLGFYLGPYLSFECLPKSLSPYLFASVSGNLLSPYLPPLSLSPNRLLIVSPSPHVPSLKEWPNFFMDEPVLYTRALFLWQGLVKYAQHVASHDCCDFFEGELRLHQSLGEENQSTGVHHGW